MPTREEMYSLANDIVRSYEDRISGVAQVKEAEAERQRTETQEIAQRKSDVGTMLKEFDDAHAAMSNELKADLAKIAPALRESEAERKRTATQEIAQRKSDVGTMLKEFDEEEAGARDEWQRLTTTMQAKRGAPVVEVRPPEAVAPPPVEEVAPPPPVEEVAEEEAVAHAEVAEVTPEIAVVRDQVFEYLANHPDGTRLVELEEEFGLARIQMARVVRNLTDENKVEKRGLLYFAI